MSEDVWTAVDEFVGRHVALEDDALLAAIANAAAAGLPAIHVSATQGELLHLLARTVGAHRILEVGTLAGYSTIWLARALGPGGRVVTLEYEERYAAVARSNLAQAGLADVVDVVVGAAAETMPGLEGPFDLVFIDADKRNTPLYFEHAWRLARPGGLIIVDNVVRRGALADADTDDADARGMRTFVEQLGRTAGARGTVIQTVGAKGYDGFALVRKDGESPAGPATSGPSRFS